MTSAARSHVAHMIGREASNIVITVVTLGLDESRAPFTSAFFFRNFPQGAYAAGRSSSPRGVSKIEDKQHEKLPLRIDTKQSLSAQNPDQRTRML